MYIKQLIVQGFKSYKDQMLIEPFSPKSNVIVGRNGSGKSNFFAAIRFVLGDEYTLMRREERQALLHEGSGSAVMSAYVEIIFDNSDERFPTGKPEVVLRRSLGVKKDEYSLDRKSATKSDVNNLLESAGFSRSNPYYIVPQGRVTEITNMADSGRLGLLKSVAGTIVYETRRKESEKILADTDNKRDQIDGLLRFIQERLAELEKEKDELREFQERNREKKCLEYTIYHHEQQRVQAELDQLDSLRQTGVHETDDNRERFLEGEQELAQIDTDINELKQHLEFLIVDKRAWEDDRKEYVKKQAQLELDVQQLETGQAAAETARQTYDRDLESVQTQIERCEKELEKLLPEFTAKKSEEDQVRVQLDEAVCTRRWLYDKQSRGATYANKKARDQHLQQQVDKINLELASQKANAMDRQETITSLEKEIASLDAELAALSSSINRRDSDKNTLEEELSAAIEKKRSLEDERKVLWREDAKLEQVCARAREELAEARRRLGQTADARTRNGLEAVRRIKQQQNITGAYGTLAELFAVSDRYKSAAETCGGKALFNYVVDTSETAERLIDALNKGELGRLTFMPLDKLRVKNTAFPQAADVRPLISRLEYDPKYEAAMRNVFGSAVVCPTLQIASQYARSHGLNAITIDGDRAERKGALTGGFHDPKQSRIDATRRYTRAREESEKREEERRTIDLRVKELDQLINKAITEERKIEQRRWSMKSAFGAADEELLAKSSQLQRLKEQLEGERRSKEKIEADMKSLRADQGAYEKDMASDFKKTLTSQEEQQLQGLEATVQDLTAKVSKLSSSRLDVERRKDSIESELQESLRPRLVRLNAQGPNGEAGSFRGSNANPADLLKARQVELERVEKDVADVKAKFDQVEASLEQAQAQLAEQQSVRDGKMAQQREIAIHIERHQKRMEKSILKKAQYTDRAADAARSIRDLGALPDEAFDKYTGLSPETAAKRLKKTNEALKKYAHVNKKAIEQYNTFTRKRDALEARRAELDKSHESIKQLIDVLDMRKDEAIERTFKQVSKEFAKVFEKLAPAGKGRLIIQRKTDRDAVADAEDDERTEEEKRRGAVENYTGVGISVSFNSKHDDQQRIQQLSGGQKSLCALALVFAIQQCDPAPFYLFDEIDANLDAQYRTAVAAMIEQLSETGQFICTTFRPEMVHKAEKCYGVAYSNKTSSVDVVTREDALQFVEGEKS